MASIETDTPYTLKLTEREYGILYDSLDYTINSISRVQTVNQEYLGLRQLMKEATK